MEGSLPVIELCRVWFVVMSEFAVEDKLRRAIVYLMVIPKPTICTDTILGCPRTPPVCTRTQNAGAFDNRASGLLPPILSLLSLLHSVSMDLSMSWRRDYGGRDLLIRPQRSPDEGVGERIPSVSTGLLRTATHEIEEAPRQWDLRVIVMLWHSHSWTHTRD